jgi:S1-C subfamily serine protease
MKKTIVCITLLLVIKVGFTQTSFTDLVSKTEKSVVMVSTYNAEGDPLKIGTAFFIDESGILYSNFHVFEKATTANT